MKANLNFLHLSQDFWANIKLLSQELGYTDRATRNILIPSALQIRSKLNQNNFSYTHIEDHYGNLSHFGHLLLQYFQYRADILNDSIRYSLMDKNKAETKFNELYDNYQPICPLPFNKQKGDKKNYAFLTGIVNILISAYRLVQEWKQLLAARINLS